MQVFEVGADGLGCAFLVVVQEEPFFNDLPTLNVDFRKEFQTFPPGKSFSLEDGAKLHQLLIVCVPFGDGGGVLEERDVVLGIERLRSISVEGWNLRSSNDALVFG